jgi:tetratricopeptide (TPR) repeat protein
MPAARTTAVNGVIAKSVALSREGMHEENEQLLRSALVRYPDSAELCLRAALAIWERGETTELLRRAVRLEPNDPGLLTQAAGVMFELGEFEEAREWGRRSRQLAPKDFPLASSLVFLAGRLAAEDDHDAKAERFLRMAFEADREQPSFGRVLADFYASRGRPVEALRAISEALRDHPDDETLLKTRDRILAEFGMDP